MKNLKLAIISDIHAHATGRPGLDDASHVISNKVLSAETDPFTSLTKLIQDDSLTADYLICCGDLTDKADPDGAHYAWNRLQELALQLNAKLLAVTGNHDMDSRFASSQFDAKGLLLSLDPPFPLSQHDLNDKYWARNYSTIVNDDYRIVLLNTSAYHGQKDESSHGRVSPHTLAAIIQELSDQGPRAVNILICHHHPVKFGELDLEDYSEIDGAGALLDAIGTGSFGNWIIVHGHRHWPALIYAPGGADAPVIFSAGSFSAYLYPDASTIYRNQFYIIDLPVPDVATAIRGRFTAWNWVVKKGWTPPSNDEMFPHTGGFGERSASRDVAAKVLQALEPPNVFMHWDDMLLTIPELQHLIPKDLNRCLEFLETEHNVVADYRAGRLHQIGRSDS